MEKKGSLSNNFYINKKICDYLELDDILKMKKISKNYYKTISKYIIIILYKNKIDIKYLENKNFEEVYKLFEFYFFKNILIFENNFLHKQNQNFVNNIKNITMIQKKIIKDIEINKNYFIIKTEEKIYYDHFKKISKNFPYFKNNIKQENMNILHNAKKYKIKKNLFYLTKKNKLLIKYFSDTGESNKDLELEIKPYLYQFKERDLKIIDFYLNENYLLIRSSNNNLYLIIDVMNLKPVDILEKKFTVFKIDFDEKIYDLKMSLYNLFFINNEGILFEIKFLKKEFDKLLEKYSTSKLVSYLVIKPRICKVFKKQKIKRIYMNNKNFFLFEEMSFYKKIEDYSNKDLIDFFIDIGFKKFEKTVINYKITGKKLIEMNSEKLKNFFGMNNFHISKLEDELESRKNIKINQPKLYAFGSNPTKHFCISNHLNYLVEINLPFFDINEEIKDIIIGQNNILLLTNFNRVFCSMKRDKILKNKRKRSGVEYGGVEYGIGRDGGWLCKDRANSNYDQEISVLNSKKKRKNKKYIKTKKLNKKNNKKNKNKNTKEKKNEIKKERKNSNSLGKESHWIDIFDYLKEKKFKITKDIHFWKIFFISNNFVFLYSKDNIKEKSKKYFPNAEEFLKFLKLKKYFNKFDLLFFDGKNQAYYNYDMTIASKKKIKVTTTIKTKSNNNVLWSEYNKYFDTKSIII